VKSRRTEFHVVSDSLAHKVGENTIRL